MLVHSIWIAYGRRRLAEARIWRLSNADNHRTLLSSQSVNPTTQTKGSQRSYQVWICRKYHGFHTWACDFTSNLVPCSSWKNSQAQFIIPGLEDGKEETLCRF